MPQVAGFFLGAFGVTAVPGVLAGGWAAGMTFASTAIGGLAVKLLASVALSALSTALAQKPKAAGIRSSQLLTGGTQSESFILGRYATNGTLAAPAMSHGNVGDTPNAYLTYVIEIGAGRHALAGLILDGEEVTIESTSPHASYGQRIGGRFNGFAWVKFYDGTQTVADPMLLAKYPVPAVRPWTADMVGRGISYAILTFRYGRRVFQGWPNVRFVADGPPLYDPRQDSTAGGSGPQRWATSSTWTRTSNPAVMVYNILRGIGGALMLWGGGVPAADLPYANWAAAMTACDMAVDNGAGGTEAQYRAGFEVIASDEPMAVIEELMKPCAGAVAENGGVWRIRVGAPGLPVKFLTDDDILIDGPEDFRPFPSIEDIFNGIEASYPDPASLWESRDADPLYNATWEAEDRGRRLVAQLDMPACPYSLQVRRVMAAIIADHRRMRRHTLTLPPDFSVVESLDVISWTSEANGYSAKLFELAEVRREILTSNVLVSLREVDPEDYDPPTGLVRPAPPDIAPSLPAAQTLPGWAVAPSAMVDAASASRRPAIVATWTAAGVQDARGVRIAIRLAGDISNGRELPMQDAATGGAVISDGILPDTTYQLRAIPVLDREVSWTAWANVTTPDIGFRPEDLDAPSFATAGLAVFGGDLRSDDFVTGISGWQIEKNGDAEFNSLVARNWIQDGAVSDIWQAVNLGPISGNVSGEIVLDLGPVSQGSVLQSGLVFEARRPQAGATVTVRVYRRAKQLGSDWTAWELLETWNVGSESTIVGPNVTGVWAVFTRSGPLTGVYDDFEYRLTWTASSTGGLSWLRNVYLTFADVKK